MTGEGHILSSIRLALGREPDVMLWRLGQGVQIDPLSRRRYRTGMIPGAADLVGVGPGGLFLGLEIKSPRGKLSWEQTSWLCLVRERGGLAAVVRSAEEAREALRRFRAGQHSWEGWPWVDV